VMPGPDTPWARNLVELVRDGMVDEGDIDEHVLRVLRLAHRVDALGTARRWPEDLPRPDSSRRHEQLTRLAASGMVVLRNQDQTLPLRPNSLGAVALIGRHSIDTIAQGGGSARVRAPHETSIAEGLKAVVGEENLHVVDGVE